MAFKPGWYRVRIEAQTRRQWCRYFRTMSLYTAECYVESSGEQYLVWLDSEGPTGPGRPAQWSAAYKWLQPAPPGDDWDRPPGDDRYQPAAAGVRGRANRRPTAKELAQRLRAVDPACANGLVCTKEIHIGIFFDGTNNNMKRDRPLKAHSNIVSLYDAHKLDESVFFAYYIPGVGTPFPEIGEHTESDNGKAFAAGGEARIHYAMIQIFNAVAVASTGRKLVSDDEAEPLVTTTAGLATLWRAGDDKTIKIFGEINQRLKQAIEGKRPKVTKVHLSVFGFSRGAAEARVFCNWMQKATGMDIGGAVLHLRFLGVFDTVASVCLADSSPIGTGFMDWADGNLDIHGVERAVHFVAGHELRMSFPLSTARTRGTYPGNTKEFIYPGAHSDVGGGYAPGDQGKATQGRSQLLSQIPLNDMYFEALNAGVALYPMTQMPAEVKSDFAIHPDLDRAFSAYANWTVVEEKQALTAKSGEAENRMHYHTRLYWRWRSHVSPDARFVALSSYRNASRQDQIDLWDSEMDWRSDVERAARAANTHRIVRLRDGAPVKVRREPRTTPLQEQLLAEVGAASTVPPAVHDFFDQYLHDSHASFYLLGPLTRYDKKVFVEKLKRKKQAYEKLKAIAAKERDPHARELLLEQLKTLEFNRFERRVMEFEAAKPGDFPPMSDADAADLRDNAGTIAAVTVKNLIGNWVDGFGTLTRREPHGHARYRRVFDQS
jgi:uncharacterized protein (DUF2235 family)